MQSIRDSACGTVKTILSMESMRVLDGSQPWAKWRVLSSGTLIPLPENSALHRKAMNSGDKD